MPEPTDPVAERVQAAGQGLIELLAEANATWAARAAEADGANPTGKRSTPRWRAFEDAFPTFYQFTNRPR
jgi:hypothetical protein